MAAYALKLSDEELARYRMMADRARVAEADLWERAGIVPGARVADVGCGPGAVLVVLAGLVGPAGNVVGVDAVEGTVEAARAMIASSGAGNATAEVGQADDTGLAAGSFDVVMMRHVLAHNGGSEQPIVDHLASLVRSGGTVYLVDVDVTAMRVMPTPDGLADLLDRYVDFMRVRGNDPQAGLTLRHRCESAGLVVEEYRGWYDILELPPGVRPPAWAAREAMVQAGVVGDADVRRWAAAFERVDAEPQRPLLFPSVFAAVARKP